MEKNILKEIVMFVEQESLKNNRGYHKEWMRHLNIVSTNALEIADFYINSFKDDIRKLRIQEPDTWARATDHISEMIDLIKKIEEKGYTYVTEDGVYFNTLRLRGYGKLARLKAKGLKAGARVEMKGKRSPTDFALWKFSLYRKNDMES